MLPSPEALDNVVTENVVEEAVGGMAGRIQETATNVQEGVPKGRGELPHVVHEVVVDLSSDYRGLNTPISIHKTTGQQGDIDTGQQKDKFNNKSEGRLSKKRRDTIKKRQNSDQVSDNGPHTEDQDVNKGRHYRPPQDDYGALNSEDELDSDNQSIDESDEEEEDNNNQPPHTFGSTFKDKWPEEVHELTAKQGLSPRGREQSRQTKQQTISTSANSGRPITRSINTQGSLERIQKLKKLHHLTLIAVLEPFTDNSQINMLRIQLQMDHAFMISFIYAKCKDHLRRPLWDRLLFYANLDTPWCTIGDFNVITSIEEKLGGMPYNMNKSFEFISVLEPCGLTDLGYTGFPLTWCNQRDAQARVWKRLDRSMVNDKWLEVMPQTTIDHLSSVGSDHSPLLLELTKTNESHTKYFKFLNFWVENATFMKTVQQCWEKGVTGNPMWRLHQKMKRLTSTLSNWSKQEYGDIFIKEGDGNTKYFHALMRGRRRRLEEWIQGEEQIAQATCNYYQHIFTGYNDRIDERILWHIPTVVTPDQNDMLQAMPTLEELRQVVFAMNPNSTAGPDGIGGKFFQACWNIIKEDLLTAVQSFFCGHIMPKFMSHACLVLLPKTEQPTTFTNLRPISLSNFTNKIISKLLSMRLATVLPLLLSANQSGFVRGRSISESIMLAQEITHRTKKTHIGTNMVIKLDMTKAYDRVSWPFTCLVPRRFGFGEVFIDLLVEKVSKKVCGWQARILSFAGRITLIKHALQSIPIHTMAAISPPRTTIKYIEAIIADFFWGRELDKRKYHWASLDTMSLTCTEGGIGIRKLTDICTSLQYKQWWTFRSKDSLWSQFLKAKYCQRTHPVAEKVDTGQSLMWKYMTRNKIIVEDYIGWKINSGSCSFWWDDWLGRGALDNCTTSVSSLNNATIAHFLVNGKWNERKLRQQGVKDTAVWKHTESGNFSCTSAWEICRKKRTLQSLILKFWPKHVPFKMSFLLWRAIRHKLPTNEKLTSFGMEPEKCYYCIQQGWDEVNHIFIQGHFAAHIWKFFAGSMGINFQKTSLSNYLLCWSAITVKNEAHMTFIQSLPILVIWPAVIDCIEKCKQEIGVTPVMWKRPPPNRYKLNTDGSALHNPGKI
ncbi:uncharacterized protein [Solanum tuberosum]|uniref:uncharacterized protein n=1 Tax=Solanum tuberosum TaxID=4113 RepID=UPI00073A19B1|nr:PREDICTED: uncharacterized protein LOC107059230 [Solanum tuberosum]